MDWGHLLKGVMIRTYTCVTCQCSTTFESSQESSMDAAVLLAPSDDKNFRGCWPLKKYNHNNAVGFVHSILEGLASSVWGDT